MNGSVGEERLCLMVSLAKALKPEIKRLKGAV